MQTNAAFRLGSTGIHSGLAALGVSDSVSMYPADEQSPGDELFGDAMETVLVFPAYSKPARSVRAEARASGFDWQELTPPQSERDTHVLGTAVELLVRCARSVDPLEPDTVESPAWVRSDPSEELALELLSQVPTLEANTLGRDELHPLWTIQRRTLGAVRANLGLQVVDSSSKHRPDSCPRCELRWDVVLNEYVGFERIASYVWKCRNCTAIVDAPMSSNRNVAKR